MDNPLLPTLPFYNRRENFARFDLETLFFVFYFQQGTY
jgi:CCR4-NOT transcriptional regulation complex NOT5 subunit